MATPAGLRWRLSGGSGLSLGGSPSTDLHSTQGTFTANASPNEARVFDGALGGLDGDHDGKYLVILDGSAALYAGRVVSYTASTGLFILDTPLPNNVLIGETYRLFTIGTPAVFPNATALQCANGTPDNRCLFVTNTSGETISANRVWLKRLDFGPLTGFEVFVDDASNASAAFPIIVDPEVGPTQAQLDTLDTSAVFVQPLSFAQAANRAPTNTVSTTNGSSRGLYVRRLIPQATKQISNAAVLLVFEGTDTAGPSQIRVPAVISVGFAGFTPDVTLNYDRRLHVGGGARVRVQVDVQELGIPAVDVDVGFNLVSPSPGSLELASAGSTTNSRGETFASYQGTDDPGDAGDDVTIEVRV